MVTVSERQALAMPFVKNPDDDQFNGSGNKQLCSVFKNLKF